MRRWALLLGICFATACATPAPVKKAAAAPTVDLHLDAMNALMARIAQAKAEGKLPALRSELEAAAKSLAPWPVVEAAFAQAPTDADTAWNRFHQVTVVTADQGGAAYWAHLGMAQVYVIWGTLDQAKAEIEAALEIAPDTVPALTRLGNLAKRRKDGAGAEAAWKRAIAAGKGAAGAPEAAVSLASAEHAAGKDADAKALVDDVLAKHPKDTAALLLAADLAAAGKAGAKAAVAFLTRAVAADPTDATLLGRLAAMQEKAGDKKAALASWQKVTGATPTDLEAWKNAARLANAVGDGAAEQAALAKVADLDAKDLDALRRLAALEVKAGENDKAEATLTRLLERKKDDPAALLARGKARVALGKLRTAMADLRAAAAAGVKGAKDDVAALAKQIGLPDKPLKGRSPNAIYRIVSRHLGKAYVERLKTLPRLGGTFSIKIWVVKGHVDEEKVVDDTLHDPVLEALAWWLVHDASFPVAKGRSDYTLPFTFTPPENGK